MASGLTTTYFLPYPLPTDPVNVASDVEDLAIAVETELLLKASLSSPTFTGTPEAPTAATDTSTTQIATTQFVINQGYLKSSTAASTYATLSSPSLTGTPTAPTASLGTDTNQIATTAYVQNELDNFVTLPSQTGANGFFLTSDGTSASWQQIQTSDIDGLDDIFSTQLPLTYSPLNATISTDSSTIRVLTRDDSADLIQMASSSSNVIMVPFDGVGEANIPIGTQIIVVQAGTGQTIIEGDSSLGGASVTVNGTPGLKLRTRWSTATLIKTASNTWLAIGDLAA